MTATSKTGQPLGRLLPIKLLNESSHNPRRRFNEKALRELAASIEEHGVITPLLVRPEGDEFEIAAGHRRLRAALLAGLTEVPAVIRPMTDQQFMEVLMVENSQREDVHPYEEAQGYRELMGLPGYDVTAVAAKISRSESYVRARLKLLQLIPEVVEEFLQDGITFAHARLIAPLDTAKQAQGLKECFSTWGKKVLLPPSELREWISGEEGEPLSSAPFALDDAELVTAAGACVTCPKSTCSEGKLFADDQGEEICYDKKCFEAKTDAHIAKLSASGLVAISTNYRDKGDPAGVIPQAEYTEIREPQPDSQEDDEDEADPDEKICPFVEEAIIATGPSRGETRKICRNPKCPVHGKKAEPTSTPTQNRANDEYRREQNKRADERKQLWEKRREIFQRIFSKWAPIIDQNFGYLYVLSNLNDYQTIERLNQFAQYFGIKVEKEQSAQKAAIVVWAEKAAAQYLRTAAIFFLLGDQIERYEHNTDYDLLAVAQDRLEEELADPTAAGVAKARAKQEPATKKTASHSEVIERRMKKAAKKK